MKQSSTLRQKLIAYSSAAGAVLLPGISTHAQIIYHDVDPDAMLELGDTFLLDLNGDGSFEYGIDARKNVAHTADKVEAFGANSSQFVDGYLGPLNYYYAKALSFGDPIGPDNDWYVANFNYVTLAFLYSTGAAYAPWAGVDDGYLALKFMDRGNTYYGWVRMDVGEDANTAVIKDFAYNATPDESINAGQTGGVGITAVEQNPWIISVQNKVVTLENVTQAGEIHVFNQAGGDMLHTRVSPGTNRLDLSTWADGLYVVTLQSGAHQYTKKIILH